MHSIGRARLSKAPASLAKNGLCDGSRPNGPRRAGHEAPPRLGRQRHTEGSYSHESQLRRKPHAGSHTRRGAGLAGRSSWSPAAQIGHAACRMPTKATITAVVGVSAGHAASRCGMTAVNSRTAKVSAITDGSANAQGHGSLDPTALLSASSSALTSISPSIRLLVPLSAKVEQNNFAPVSKSSNAGPRLKSAWLHLLVSWPNILLRSRVARESC